MFSLFQNLFDIVLPPRCIYCGKICETENSLCVDCFQKINFITDPYCKCCGMPFENTVNVNQKMLCPECLKTKPLIHFHRSAIHYDEFSKQAILSFKFMDKEENAKVFAKWLMLAGRDIFESGIDTIIPVPLSYQRLIHRRYNQSAILARELGRLTSLKVDTTNLVKIKNTKPQTSFLKTKRLTNLKNAFDVKNKDAVKEKRILLIDDVRTTGATLNECAKVLLKNGAKSVDSLTIARVIKE